MAVISDIHWEKALHGFKIYTVVFDDRKYSVCSAKVIDRCSGRCDNPYNLALMLRFHQTYQQWQEFPWFAVCDENDEELFLIQSPEPRGMIDLLQLDNRMVEILKIRKYGVEQWLSEHGVSPDMYNNYQLAVERFKAEYGNNVSDETSKVKTKTGTKTKIKAKTRTITGTKRQKANVLDFKTGEKV